MSPRLRTKEGRIKGIETSICLENKRIVRRPCLIFKKAVLTAPGGDIVRMVTTSPALPSPQLSHQLGWKLEKRSLQKGRRINVKN